MCTGTTLAIPLFRPYSVLFRRIPSQTGHTIVVVEQNELQNECRSRETCSFGTPDAVVCKAARSASAVLAAVGPSVGIGARAGAGFEAFAKSATQRR